MFKETEKKPICPSLVGNLQYPYSSTPSITLKTPATINKVAHPQWGSNYFAGAGFVQGTSRSMFDRQYYEQVHKNQQQLAPEEVQYLHQKQHWTTARTQAVQATAPVSNQQGDEISKSLKMFAMTALKAGNEPTQSDPPVDAVMREFASNGYNCDDLKQSYQQYHAALNVATYQRVNIYNNHDQTQNVNMNINNIWKIRPSQAQNSNGPMVNAAYTYANVASIKKPQRRGSVTKNEKYSPGKQQHCVFCENNNEPEAVIRSHAVRDSLGRVLCPKLRTYVCPICKASGDNAHTIKYCPRKPIITMEDAIKAESFRLAKGTSCYNQQMLV